MHEYYECESCPLCGAEIYRLISGYDASEHFQHCESGSEKVQLVIISGHDFIDLAIVFK